MTTFKKLAQKNLRARKGFSHFPDAQNDRQKDTIQSFNMFMLCYGV